MISKKEGERMEAEMLTIKPRSFNIKNEYMTAEGLVCVPKAEFCRKKLEVEKESQVF